MTTRRLFPVLLAALPLFAVAGAAWARETHLPRPMSLATSAKEAQSKGQPLVLLVSLPGCPYCELVRRSYLLPLRDSEALPAMQIDTTDRKTAVADFAGQRSSGHELAKRWQVRVTPTVLFFDAQGKEIAPRLEGVAVPDFYGSYLDERLAQARQALKSSAR
jgi:thioredoxin-related protein